MYFVAYVFVSGIWTGKGNKIALNRSENYCDIIAFKRPICIFSIAASHQAFRGSFCTDRENLKKKLSQIYSKK